MSTSYFQPIPNYPSHPHHQHSTPQTHPLHPQRTYSSNANTPHPPLHSHAHPHLHHPHPHHHQPAPFLAHSNSYPASSSTLHHPQPIMSSNKLAHTHSHHPSRPKPMKKPSGSTSNKHKSVQLSLELKVERAKGFHAFFVPLARTLPPAPPSSPVLGSAPRHTTSPDDITLGHGGGTRGAGAGPSGGGGGNSDYFSGWDRAGKVDSQEHWVENVDEDDAGSSGMEVDSE